MGRQDLQKTYKELINILDKKLQDKKVGNNYTKIIQNCSKLPAKLFNKIRFLYEKYYSKYDSFKIKFNDYRCREEATDSAIKFYSNYKALNVIGNVCNEILESTNNCKNELTGDQIKEFMGALDVAKLAKEQKKFELRAKNGKFGNEKGEVRIAEVLAAHEKMKAIDKEKSKDYYVNTPFGQIKINCKFEKTDTDSNKETRMISVANVDNTEYTYKDMARNIESTKFRALKKPTKKQIVNSIKQYINQKCNLEEMNSLNTQQILNDLKSFEFQGKRLLDENSWRALSVLCGCLLFAESAEIRNPTRGKWEKKAIEKVERLVNEDYENPFSVVFAGDKAQLFDKAYGGCEVDINTMYTPAKPRANLNKPYMKGGQYEAEWLISGKVDIKRTLLTKKEHPLYDNLIKVLEKICPDGLAEVDKWSKTKNKFNALLSNTSLKDEDKKTLEEGKLDIQSLPKGYYKLYLKSDKKHEKIKIDDIPDDYKKVKEYITNVIKKNRQALYELNS